MNTLRICGALIRKDVKSIFWFLAILLLFDLIAIFRVAAGIHGDGILFRYIIPTFPGIQTYTLPAIFFAFAFNLEWNTGTRNLVLSLPSHRYLILLGKLVPMVLAAAMLCLISLFLASRILPWYGTLPPFGGMFSGYLQKIFLYASAACLAQGIISPFRRFRFALWVFAFLAAPLLYLLAAHQLLEWLQVYHPSWLNSPWLRNLRWETGLVFLLSGLFLFDRYAEG